LDLEWNTGLSPYFGNGYRQPNGWDAMAKGKSLRPTAIILVKVRPTCTTWRGVLGAIAALTRPCRQTAVHPTGATCTASFDCPML